MDLPIREVFRIFDANDSGEISKAEFFNVIDTVHKGATNNEKELIAEFADVDGDGFIQFDEFIGLFSQLDELSGDDMNKLKTVNPNADIYFYIDKAFMLDIKISKYWMEKDEQKEGSIAKSDFMNCLRWLPLGLLENDIKRIMD